MTIQFNHTIVWSRDSAASAAFLAQILGLPAPRTWGDFRIVETANGVSIDFLQQDGEISPQHYAFLVSEAEFDEIFRRLTDKGLTYWADPARKMPAKVNTRDGGRGVYFQDPDGHLLEIITRPYGSGGWNP